MVRVGSLVQLRQPADLAPGRAGAWQLYITRTAVSKLPLVLVTLNVIAASSSLQVATNEPTMLPA